MSNRVTIPPDTEPVPVTAQELTWHMERLLSQVSPRVLCEVDLPAEETSYSFIEPLSLIDELARWNSDN